MNLVINESQPLWEYLRCAEKPVVLYGMGDGALKILAVCRQYGIPVAGIFASDEFVRGHSFEGYPVESLAQIEERLGDFIVLLCFGVDYEDVYKRQSFFCISRDTTSDGILYAETSVMAVSAPP